MHQHRLIKSQKIFLRFVNHGQYLTSISDLDSGDILSNLDCAADDLVTNAERQWDFTPATSDAVKIRATNAAGVNGNINVPVLERLELELEDR